MQFHMILSEHRYQELRAAISRAATRKRIIFGIQREWGYDPDRSPQLGWLRYSHGNGMEIKLNEKGLYEVAILSLTIEDSIYEDPISAGYDS